MNKEDIILWFGAAGIIITGIVMKLRQKKAANIEQAKDESQLKWLRLDIDAIWRILIYALPGLLLTIILHLYGLWIFTRSTELLDTEAKVAKAGKWGEIAYNTLANVGNGFHQIETLFVLVTTWLLLIVFKVKATTPTKNAVRNFRLILLIPLFLFFLGVIVHIFRNGTTISGLTPFSTVFFFLNLKVIGTAVISLGQIYFINLLLKKDTSLYSSENLSPFARVFSFNIVLGLLISIRDLVFFFSKYGTYMNAGNFTDVLNDVWLPVATVSQVVATVVSIFCWYVPFAIIEDNSNILRGIKKSAIIFSVNFGSSALAFCLIFALQFGLVSLVEHKKAILESIGSGIYVLYLLLAPSTFLIPLIAANIQNNIYNLRSRGDRT